MILERDGRILTIKRKKEPFKDQLALPGGFIEAGETAEDAARREASEETSLEVEPIDVLGVYSDPKRDPRAHSMSVVFICIIVGGELQAGDDAAAAEWIPLDRIPSSKLAFDHSTILADYVKWKSSGGTFWSTKRR
jgi:ADP-ribose pyrophosphatase YjhB (NUDIX family)